MITTNNTPREIVNYNGHMLHILKRYDIYFNDKKTLSTIAKKNGHHEGFLVDLLNAFNKLNSNMVNQFSSYETPILVDYLRRSHSYYLERRLPEIIFSMHETCRLQPALFPLKKFLNHYTANLQEHFEQEDLVLFPYADYLHAATASYAQSPLIESYFYEFSLKDFLHEKDTENDLKLMRLALEQHFASNNERSPYRVTLDLIKNFENDLKIHAIIEDQILIPRMISIEQKKRAQLLN